MLAEHAHQGLACARTLPRERLLGSAPCDRAAPAGRFEQAVEHLFAGASRRHAAW